MREKVRLGDEVKDSVSGFRGIAVAAHTYLHGCTRISVQPKIDKKGVHPDALSFDGKSPSSRYRRNKRGIYKTKKSL